MAAEYIFPYSLDNQTTKYGVKLDGKDNKVDFIAYNRARNNQHSIYLISFIFYIIKPPLQRSGESR